MDLSNYRYTLEMTVRDYEVDYQGIVNNSNYLHYTEHTRHEFCKKEGLSIRKMHAQGIDPVVVQANLHFITTLHLGEDFISCLNVERRGPKFVFFQDIYTKTGTAVLKSEITIACLENGSLSRGDVLANAFNI